jgi:hypothetical protein
MMTTREMAIARTVLYSSLFDYPLTLDELHRSLFESDQTAAEILAVYEGSPLLQYIVEYREGFFFPVDRADLVAERRAREARSHEFLRRHERLLRVVCALPFTRLVALSGSVAHLNLEATGDLDLFIVTRGASVWTVTVAVLAIAKLLRRRRSMCANFIVADTHLRLEQRDLFTANQVVHLRPLIGVEVWKALVAANPYVGRFHPNAVAAPNLRELPIDAAGGAPPFAKRLLELALALPLPLVEAVCRRLYAWHLRRRAASWRSPEQVQLRSDYLKLHTQSHRQSVLDRFESAMERACRAAAVREQVSYNERDAQAAAHQRSLRAVS